MNTHVKAALATIAIVIGFIAAVSYPTVFFVILFLIIAGILIYNIYCGFLGFFNKKVK